jgi:hypothetical protein
MSDYEIISVVAVDPGPTTGMCFLDYQTGSLGLPPQPQCTLLQADGKSADAVLEAMLARWYGVGTSPVTKRYAVVEKFVTGRGAGTKGAHADVTRQLVMELTERLQLHGYKVVIRQASDVKVWATDKRLVAAGIVGDSAIHGKARDAYDAARHAIYCAVKDAKMKDPLA